MPDFLFLTDRLHVKAQSKKSRDEKEKANVQRGREKGKVGVVRDGGKRLVKEERRSDGVWGRGVKEESVSDWRETLERTGDHRRRWRGRMRGKRERENHPHIIKSSERLALKFCSQHFLSLDFQLYC